MLEYGFSPTCIFQYSVLIRENKGYEKSVFWHSGKLSISCAEFEIFSVPDQGLK